MHSVIHSKPLSRLTLLSAISYALISIFTPVSSVFATASASENMTFSVVVSDTPTLTLILESNNLALNLTPGMATATFGSDDFDVTVGTSNSAGYSLTMTASSSNLSSANGYSIASLDEDRTNFPDGYTESNFTTNSWGFKRNSGIYAGENYQPVTTDETYINSSTVPTNGVTSNVTFASKVDHTIPAGAYSTTLTFVATANVVANTCDPGYICYDDNDANSPTKMANQSATSNEDTTLWASNFQYKGHGFLGWNTQADGLGTMYGPNETVNVDLTAGGLQLYATWLPKSTQYTMQSFTDGVCKTKLVATTYDSETGKLRVSPNSYIALEDARDGNVYAVARLADGQCWMIENLRLADTPFNVNNTHNPALPLTQSDGTSTANQLSAASNDWCTANNTTCEDKSMLNTAATDSTVSESTGNSVSDGYSANIYSYGNYYNWYSVTAGNGKYATVNGETLAKNASTIGDICPTNWRLPIGGAFPNTNMQNKNGTPGTETTDNRANSDYYKLFHGMLGIAPNYVHDTAYEYTHYGDVATANDYQPASTIGTTSSQLARKYPNNLTFSGRQYGSSADGRGVVGYYWSSTAYNTGDAYILNYNSTLLHPGTSHSGKFFGYVVRCIAGN